MMKLGALISSNCGIFLYAFLLMTASFCFSQRVLGADTNSVEVNLKNQPDTRKYGSEVSFFLYKSDDRREPFISLLDHIKKASETPPATILPMQKLSVYKLLGIMSGVDGYSAMIEDSDGNRNIVTSGSIVGAKSWKVSEITRNRLVLEKFNRNTSQQEVAGEQTITLSFSN